MDIKKESGLVEYDLIAIILIASLFLLISTPLHRTIKQIKFLKDKSLELECIETSKECKKFSTSMQNISVCSDDLDKNYCSYLLTE